MCRKENMEIYLYNFLNEMENMYNNQKILQIINKWKWHIALAVFIGGVLAAIFSGPRFITPQYKSYAVLFPANLHPVSDESTTEQMLQWLKAQDIADSMIVEFDLAKHYGIDSTHRHFRAKMLEAYNDNIKISKTEYESVEINVLDKDPMIACNMVNRMIVLYNNKVRRTHREKIAEHLSITKKMFVLKQRELDSVLRIHGILRSEHGIIDYANQTREVTRGLLRTVDGCNANIINTQEVLKLKKSLEEKGGDFIKNNTLLYDILGQYTSYKNEYEKLMREYQRELSYASIISHPFPADKQVSPTRWLIVMITMVAVFLAACCTAVYLEVK